MDSDSKIEWIEGTPTVGEILDKVRDLELELKSMGWQPIETAPTDGTPVDIWVPSCWGGERAPGMRRTELSATNVFFEPVAAGQSYVRDATHWRPIPDEPNY